MMEYCYLGLSYLQIQRPPAAGDQGDAVPGSGGDASMSETIGDFEIIGRIGEGGMGEVFKGRDTMLERDVAIKALRPQFAARVDVVERFRTEAVALARLSHPNIAAVYRFFRHADTYYMVMEFVAGETLDQLVARRGALPWQEVVRYGMAALAGLMHAHHAGVVHRDIKPANIMVAPDGTAKLMDFRSEEHTSEL